MTNATFADPITTEVIRNFLRACAEDMNAALFRSAYTPIIYEGRDCAVALMDRDGQQLGQSAGVPLFLCNLEVCVQHTLERFGHQWFEPGDIIAMNDPYIQGSHLHDVTVFGPIFYENHLVGFAATRAHWKDLGGKDPGTTMQSTDVYQEGFRLGPTKVFRAYEPVVEWIDFLRRNSRFGHELIGDMYAQVTACVTGEERVRQMLERVGLDVFEESRKAIFEQAAVLHSEAVRALPDGVYRRSGVMDNDGVRDQPVTVEVTVVIQDGSMTVDLSGTGPQQEGPLNCGYAQTVSAIQLAYKSLIKPDLPVTGGAFEPLHINVPEDCFLNAKEPAACEWYFSGLGLLVTLIISALAPALGEDAVGPDYGDSMVIELGGTRVGPDGRASMWINSEPTAGGWGGHARGDGESALANLNNGAFKNIPVEVFETKNNAQIIEFSLRADSGGPGRYRGGCGVTRRFKLLQPSELSLWFERSRTPAWGLNGGAHGRGPHCHVDGPAGHWEGLKVNRMELPPESIVTVQTGGGGGFGDALERPLAEVQADVQAGLVTIDGARRDYSVVLDPEAFTVDQAATDQLRHSLRR